MAKNGKNLVIVESPAKAKTINKYLGDGYIVKASMGHVRDLPRKGGMGVDLETFQPEYTVLESRGKIISELKKLAKDSTEVYLATDLDREGEAIAWHLKEALGIPDSKARRVVFNAITKSEIQKAFKNTKSIDMDRVNAQQARRILDRIVGFEISPLLWKKVAKGLSAGRVQSVAVRLVVDREREIDKFMPAEYWKIGGIFSSQTDGQTCQALQAKWIDFLTNTGNGERTKHEREQWLTEHEAFEADLVEVAGKKFEASNKQQAKLAAELLGYVVDREQTTEDPDAKGTAKALTKFEGHLAKCPSFAVRTIEKKRTTSKPPAPFITSKLQQAASSRLSFGAQRTMRIAQTLYEAGHITYMRTDSTNLSPEALAMARGFVKKEFGDRYVPEKPNYYSSSNKSAQEAHEAIRPTDVALTPADAKAKLGVDEWKVYQLIWNRFVACQMPPAEFDQTAVTLSAKTSGGDVVFRATGRKLVFDGFMKVAGISSEDQLLPELREKQPVTPIELTPTQHFTQPPARYTEATLVGELEKLGIGRPSTYASIIQTIQDREYVVQIDRRFYATMLGSIVTDKLMQGFPDIMDVKFTAGMEDQLDEVEEHHADWIKLLRDFYGPFHKEVEDALDTLEHAGGTPSPYMCPKCGKPLLYRISKNGFFLACSDRECKTTQPVDQQGKPTLREVSEFKCPNCGREMIKRKGRFGEFLGCSGYSVKNEAGEPSCSTIINLDKEGKPLPPKTPPIPTTIKCEKDGGVLLLRDGKRGPWLGCKNFPKCRGMKSITKLDGDQRKQVEALVPLLKEGAARSAEMIAKITGENPVTASAAQAQNITTDIDCDECGKPMIIRNGRRGKFLGCSGYPKCKNTSEVPAKLLEELGLNGSANGNGKAGSNGEAHEEKTGSKKPKGRAIADESEEIETDLLVE
jgi:DNA topoisomerase-1